MTRRLTWLILILGFIAGLFVRYSLLFEMGGIDITEYQRWGRDALAIGVPHSYHGVYFPLQYHVFEFCVAAANRFGLPFFTSLKLANLLFDLLLFSLLLLFLEERKASPLYALLYWLHPWFLTVFSLGYIDFQFSFFVLFAVWLVRRKSTWNYFLASLPLGCAFLMKPQAQILILATFFYCCFRWLRTKDLRPFAMLAGPVLFFAYYEWFFVHTLRRPRFVHAAILPLSYLNVANVMPALTALMPNIWTPVAYLLKQPGQQIVRVSDQVHLLPYIPAKYLAATLVLLLIGAYAYHVGREDRSAGRESFLALFTFASLVVPFLMTSAHENHLFLGTVFFVLFTAGPGPLRVKVAIQVLLLVQTLNLVALYGIHPQSLASSLRAVYSDALAIAYAFVGLSCFAVIAHWLWKEGAEVIPPDSPESVCS